jgi:hypothetical protein
MEASAPYHGDNLDILPDGKKIDRPPQSVAFKQALEATGRRKETESGL